ncbi:NAD(P)H-binding protein [candidate division KSB1 bacterium]|nr:NAD(P)H-binding protein [candidate division KSB1 bacterium]RQW05636.1 MAG: NAD-dependent epimerase/dehydratase family protein [candidate division KSB1 bacterium]
MRVFVTGATGYVGGFILQELRRQHIKARCLVRTYGQAERINADGTEAVIGDITNPKTLEGILTGCDAVIHLVAIIEEDRKKDITFARLNYEATKNMVDLALAQGVRRFLHMSALGADVNGATAYFRSKGKAEACVRDSGLNYTIFRPSFIFGPGDAVFTMLAKTIKKVPLGLMPHFGIRRYRHQPVSIYDVTRGIVNALENEKTFHKTYDVGGPHPLSYKEQLRAIASAIDAKVHLVPLPLFISRIVVAAMALFPSSPIDQDKLTMLTLDNVCDPRPFAEDFRIDLMPFRQGITYLKK